MILRPYQQTGVADIKTAFHAGNKSVLYTLPTGGGKTIIFSHILKAMANAGRPCMVLVHRRELLLQTVKQLKELGLEFSTIQAGLEYKPALISIASVQTLVKRPGIWIFPELIICDECHHMAGKNQWAQIRTRYQASRLLGVTATPERLDGRGLGDSFDILVQGPNIQELTKAGYLSPIKYYSVDFSKGVDFRTRAGDYDKKQMEDFFTQKKIYGSTVEHFKKHFGGNKTALIFCVTIKHAEQISYQLRLSGFDCPVISGKLDYGVRQRLIEDLGNRVIHGLVSCDIISEGTDIPTVDGCVLLRRTQSLGLFLQQVGRCLRIAPGKKEAIVLDHAGNIFIHGHPGQAREWELKKSETKKKEKKYSQDNFAQCQKCYFVFKINIESCPECGEKRKVADMSPKEINGELKEIKQVPLSKDRENADTLEKLVEVGKRRGYKAGWAKHVWKAREEKKGARA